MGGRTWSVSFVQTLVQVPDLPQLQSLVDCLKNVGDLLTVAVTKYGDLHLQVSTSLVTVGSEFRKLRVVGDRGKIWHLVVSISINFLMLQPQLAPYCSAFQQMHPSEIKI